MRSFDFLCILDDEGNLSLPAVLLYVSIVRFAVMPQPGYETVCLVFFALLHYNVKNVIDVRRETLKASSVSDGFEQRLKAVSDEVGKVRSIISMREAIK